MEYEDSDLFIMASRLIDWVPPNTLAESSSRHPSRHAYTFSYAVSAGYHPIFYPRTPFAMLAIFVALNHPPCSSPHKSSNSSNIFPCNLITSAAVVVPFFILSSFSPINLFIVQKNGTSIFANSCVVAATMFSQALWTFLSKISSSFSGERSFVWLGPTFPPMEVSTESSFRFFSSRPSSFRTRSRREAYHWRSCVCCVLMRWRMRGMKLGSEVVRVVMLRRAGGQVVMVAGGGWDGEYFNIGLWCRGICGRCC